MSDTPRPWLTIRQAADIVGVCPKTIRRRIADGTITGYRMGPRIIRVNLDEVHERLGKPIPAMTRTVA